MSGGAYFKWANFADHQTNGLMYYNQYLEALRKYKLFPVTVKESFYGTAFRLSDRDNSGYISEDEYNKMYRAYCRVNTAGDTVDKMVYFIFCLLDSDASGLITVDEMKPLLRMWGLKEDTETVLQYMNIVDFNHSGKISYEEFYHFKQYLY